eukprot:TRINITY_DN2890_c3_g1::TRINITY_DN2890_c3_g1_i16::g.5832::m.5832 TRINITY_DN2890_c3_g1::TRINITY_DN2890_c3_g1_i16::g.5832  ORF type:complete len:290 (-),score=17.54,GPI2/PF06432.6/1.9,GPI2/PF06432.6/25 TRINITY_DN2890_c3_g1_i16:1056-1925(-)
MTNDGEVHTTAHIVGKLSDVRLFTVTFFSLAFFDVIRIAPRIIRRKVWQRPGLVGKLLILTTVSMITHILSGYVCTMLIVNGILDAWSVSMLVITCVCNTLYQTFLIKLICIEHEYPTKILVFMVCVKDGLSLISAIIVLYYLFKGGVVLLFEALEDPLMQTAKYTNLIGNICYMIFFVLSAIHDEQKRRTKGMIYHIALPVAGAAVMVISTFAIPHSIGLALVSLNSVKLIIDLWNREKKRMKGQVTMDFNKTSRETTVPQLLISTRSEAELALAEADPAKLCFTVTI